MHLQIWQWIFCLLGLLCGLLAMAIAVFCISYSFSSGLISTKDVIEGLLALIIVFLPFAAGAFISFAMGKRCHESRVALSVSDRATYEWAVQAFSAMWAFSVPIALLAIVIVFAVFWDRSLWFVIPFVSGALTLPCLLFWSCVRVHAATKLFVA
jgi:hypothetical protein